MGFMLKEKIDYQNFLVDTKDSDNKMYLNDFYRWLIRIFQCNGLPVDVNYKYYGFKEGKLVYSNSIIDNLQVVKMGYWMLFGSGLFKKGQRVIDNKGDIWTIKGWDSTYFYYLVTSGNENDDFIFARFEKDLMPL